MISVGDEFVHKLMNHVLANWDQDKHFLTACVGNLAINLNMLKLQCKDLVFSHSRSKSTWCHSFFRE